jgi:hypothetical protein
MFSPTLFYDYYSTNQYDILSSYLFEYTSPGNSSWKVFQYVPGCLDFLSFGGFGKKMVGIWFVARRILQSTDGIIPRQRACLKSWETQEMSRSSISNNMKRALKKIPKLRSLIVFFRGKIARLIHHRRLKKVKV